MTEKKKTINGKGKAFGGEVPKIPKIPKREIVATERKKKQKKFKCSDIEHELCELKTFLGAMQMNLDELKSKVDTLTTVTQSVVALLQSKKDDQAKIQAVADAVDTNATALADAVTTNTPISPP